MKTFSSSRISSTTLLLLAVAVNACNSEKSDLSDMGGDFNSSLGGAGSGAIGGDGGAIDGAGGPTETCETGSFAAEPGGACKPWTDCDPSEFVEEEGSDVEDRVCEPCADGYFSTVTNASSCVEHSSCEFSTATAGTAMSDAICNGAPHLSAGYLHTCGLKENGTVSCWGRNAEGQLGGGAGLLPGEDSAATRRGQRDAGGSQWPERRGAERQGWWLP